MTRVLITGGTGLVGSRLVKKFDSVVVTSRNAESARRKLGGKVEAVQWESYHEPLDLTSAGPIDAVINLMGESIAEGRWNAAKKQRIRESRVIGTERLVEALSRLPKKPECLVSASAVGYYGDHGAEMITESFPQGSGFLADVCKAWEVAARPAAAENIRVANLRIGVVLATEGGALAEMLPIFRKGIGGRLGNGRQYFPWIHLDDLVSLIHWLVLNKVSGPFNGTAPTPVSNSEFTKTLAATIHRPALLPVPQFALKLALGEFAASLFASQRVVPDAAVNAGFEFKFPELKPAMQDLLG